MRKRLFQFSILIVSGSLLFASCSTAQTCDYVPYEKQISDLRQELNTQKAHDEQEIDKAKQTYDQLAASLKDEIQKDQVTIDQYKGVLTINMVDKIFFDSGKAIIKKDGYGVLDRVGKILNSVPNKIIRIEGHTDRVPIAEAYKWKYPNNWALGARRAVNVAEYFQDKVKIDPKRLEVVSFSKYRPVAPNDTAMGRAKNRRIEIVLENMSLYQMMEMKKGLSMR